MNIRAKSILLVEGNEQGLWHFRLDKPMALYPNYNPGNTCQAQVGLHSLITKRYVAQNRQQTLPLEWTLYLHAT